jgi:hypothetical protein
MDASADFIYFDLEVQEAPKRPRRIAELKETASIDALDLAKLLTVHESLTALPGEDAADAIAIELDPAQMDALLDERAKSAATVAPILSNADAAASCDSSLDKPQTLLAGLQVQQQLLAPQPTTKATECTTGIDHPVAGNDDGNGVVVVRTTDGA